MRKLLIGAITGAVMLAVAAIAFGATQQTYEQTYVNKNDRTVKTKNASVGTNFEVTSIDEENTGNNQQPPAARQVKIKFPAGSKIDYRARAQCKDLDESAENPCPRNTIVGTGNAEARLKFNGTDPIPADVTAYNRKNGLWLYVVPSVPGQAPVVLKPTFKGLTLTTNIPPLCVLNDCEANGEAVLTRFKLVTKPYTKGKGRRKRTFIKTPRRCPGSGVWRFNASFKYGDGTEQSLNSDQTCK